MGVASVNIVFSGEYRIIANADWPRTLKAVAIVDSQNCRITLNVEGWIIIQTVCLCCLKPGVPVLDQHAFRRRNDIRSIFISSKREKLSSL